VTILDKYLKNEFEEQRIIYKTKKKFAVVMDEELDRKQYIILKYKNYN
jgi:hypothetical protein